MRNKSEKISCCISRSEIRVASGDRVSFDIPCAGYFEYFFTPLKDVVYEYESESSEPLPF